MQNKEPFYYHFFFTWTVLTLIYLLGYISSFPGGFFVYVVGLFVPFGFWNIFASFSVKGIITFPLLIFSFYKADAQAVRLNITTLFKRVVFNLVWLLLLTIVIDLVLWGTWASLGNVMYCPIGNSVQKCMDSGLNGFG